MAIANLLLSMSVTMLVPALPIWLMSTVNLDSQQTGLAMGAFAVGLFLPGALCSYLVQHYRRNIVFLICVLVLAVSMTLPFYRLPVLHAFPLIIIWRTLQGVAFGLAQMVLTSTLVIDTCESHQRTEANHSATWFGRFALSLGPMFALLLMQLSGLIVPSPITSPAMSTLNVFFLAMVCCIMAVVLVLFIHFPFRVPEDNLHLFSLDRFFLMSGLPLFFNLFLVTLAIGMLMSLPVTIDAYGMVMVGFLLALLAQRFVFCDAELKSEAVSGMLLIGASLIILLASRYSPLTTPILGLGLGLVGGRFLLFFIKLSRHCQRGTSQSTFMLGWESGLAIGVGLGFYVFHNRHMEMLLTALILDIVALLMYVIWTHRWFLAHKNR
ncbi:MFS transporter [Prevotella sp. E2-28]|uniref:MFS transporter n=1 Tax=Prevotella sp. E2-28 TaxID=2913620 RepID=UPI001EDB7D9B|nr:MFS transporter [Prevotella sp. E2-28]UKK52560.1 MFS transporter [Prevotella sp. E2-28]